MVVLRKISRCAIQVIATVTTHNIIRARYGDETQQHNKESLMDTIQEAALNTLGVVGALAAVAAVCIILIAIGRWLFLSKMVVLACSLW